MAQYKILGTFGHYEIRQRTDTSYNFVEIIDTDNSRRLACTYTKQKDFKKWARNKATQRIAAVQKNIMRQLAEIERLQKDQVSFEDFKERLDNPNPVDIKEIYGN